MTYQENDQDYASGKAGKGGKSGRDKDISQARERMSKPGEATEQDKELMNKWAEDVDSGHASPSSEDFVNAMKAQGGWSPSPEEGGGLVPPTAAGDQQPCPEGQVKDCLGICGGGRILRNDGGGFNTCCKDSEVDCAGKCFGVSIVVGDICCDRSDPDFSAFCCLNPIEGCNPPCPKPGQIINGHELNNGCWCTPGQDEHCCSASLLDSGGRCPGDTGYKLWAYEISEDACQCNEVDASNLNGGGFTSKAQCEAACSGVLAAMDSDS